MGWHFRCRSVPLGKNFCRLAFYLHHRPGIKRLCLWISILWSVHNSALKTLSVPCPARKTLIDGKNSCTRKLGSKYKEINAPIDSAKVFKEGPKQSLSLLRKVEIKILKLSYSSYRSGIKVSFVGFRGAILGVSGLHGGLLLAEAAATISAIQGGVEYDDYAWERNSNIYLPMDVNNKEEYTEYWETSSSSSSLASATSAVVSYA